MNPPLNAAMRSSLCDAGTRPVRRSRGSAAEMGSVVPGTSEISARARSMATTATAENERFGSGCTSAFTITGRSSGASADGLEASGTQVPSLASATPGNGGAKGGGGNGALDGAPLGLALARGADEAAREAAGVAADEAAVGSAAGASQYCSGSPLDVARLTASSTP
jgi:hypothetical protein